MNIVIVSHCQVVPEYQSDVAELINLGHRVTLITPEVYKEGGREVVATSLDSRTNHVPLKTVFGRNGKQHFHFYVNILRIIKIVRSEKPDVLYLYEEPNSLVTIQMLLLARLSLPRLKVIVWTACNTKRDYKLMYRFFDIRRYLFDFNIGLSNKLADSIVAISIGAAEVIRWKGWTKPAFVSPTHFIDPERFKPRLREDSQVLKIGVIGRLQRQKGFDLVIEALSRINHDYTLEIYGEGAEQENLLKQIDSLGISERCHWHGSVPYQEIPREIRSLDLLIVPSREIGHLKEQFGRVVIEAMSSGVNVIVSDSGYLPKLVGKLGLVFKEDSVDELTEKIEYFLQDENRFSAQDLREHAIRGFSAKATAKRLDIIYSYVLTNKEINCNSVVNIYGE